MERKVYNCFGEDITGMPVRYKDEAFGYIGEDGTKHTHWEKPNDVRDEFGFDKRYRPIEGSEDYIIKNYIVPKGTVLARYGNERGSYTTLRGSKYETLGLPYDVRSVEYHEYVVSIDVCVDLVVDKGITAPAFDSLGQGIQFKHKNSIAVELNLGLLKEDYRWRIEHISRH